MDSGSARAACSKGIALRHGYILREGAVLAVFGAGDSQHSALIAKIDPALTAIFARPAIDCRIERDARSSLPTFDLSTGLHDHAGGFMAHDDRRLPAARASVHAMHVAAANAADFDSHHDGIGPQRRCRHILQGEAVVLFESKSYHARSLL
jgi:hypothetical protein